MNPIESTYFHRMTVNRNQSIKNEFGATISNGLLPVEGLINIPCGFSQSTNSQNNNQTEIANIINTTPKLFCNPSLKIKTGDKIDIKYNGLDMGQYETGQAYYYDSHQEIPLKQIRFA